ncbi:hypothetical protein GSY71_04545 [Pusillimonas sp. TS35]|uniref:hypothetical protein n=1 Tax=Paracandidimonas lactea TaxID=2895524 RepID=UPI001370AF3C|nr:hypothetical protein [Paracandidimonas lactea]MYN12419.1 hypothetical protein [Pusillimonas sp. TS35]
MNILLTNDIQNNIAQLVVFRDLLAGSRMRVLTLQVVPGGSIGQGLSRVPEAGPEHPVYLNAGHAEEGVSAACSKAWINSETWVVYVCQALPAVNAVAQRALTHGLSCLTLHIARPDALCIQVMDLVAEVAALALHRPPPIPCELVASVESDRTKANVVGRDRDSVGLRLSVRMDTDTPARPCALTEWLDRLLMAIHGRMSMHGEACTCCALAPAQKLNFTSLTTEEGILKA